MALTEIEYDARIAELEEALGNPEAEVSFDGETTKYRTYAEIMRGIRYFKQQKQYYYGTKQTKNKAYHVTITRGLG